ncbi:amino acid adenylation domain-containing protein [Corallococcus sp. bb12-1]|uniref:non-ribosomal peptide synthetase n=1 Tax=Corallococcus sp. bb12-1 TaxID=2996784 RepID=UPI00226FC590|nr:non-ribosomal peptide synthetase [Corallococcus sp. bb12-1]MCY1042397.1 amino acid adenylation domain-containing protein [Corallococcus sp. bb12-1]
MDTRTVFEKVWNAELSPEEALRLLRSTTARWPLGDGQQALWLAHALAPGGASYNIPLAQYVRPGADLVALRRALDSVVRRHPVLASTFVEEQGTAFQCAPGEPAPVAWTEVDAEGLEDAALVARAREQGRLPFELEAGPVLRVTLFRRSTRPSLLLTCVHHLCFDGVSLGLLLRHWMEAYAGRPAPLAAEPVGAYAEFVAHEEAFSRSPAGLAAEAFWRARLEGGLPTLELPIARPRRGPTLRGDTVVHALDAAMGARVRACASRRGMTPFTLFLAAYQVLLSRYSGQRRIAVAVPMEGRPTPRFDEVIGYFVRVLPLVGEVREESSVAGFLAQVHDGVMEALRHGDHPLFTLARQMRVSPTPAVGLYFQSWTRDLDVQAEGSPLGPPLLDVQQEGELGLILEVLELPTGFRLRWKHDPDVMPRDGVERLARHFAGLLEQVVDADDARRVGELQLLLPEERALLLGDWNRTRTDREPAGTWVERFSAQARRSPERVAVRSGEHTRTYRELEERSDALALALRERGVEKGSLVGVLIPRTVELPGVLLGVLKAGAAYVPLDPIYPPERLEAMLTDARVRAVVTDLAAFGTHPALRDVAVKVDAAATGRAGARLAPEHAPGPDGAAYVIYTSGSTGAPKGVRVLHRNLANFTDSMLREPGLSAEDTVLAVTTVCFDIAVLELLVPLAAGACVEVVPTEVCRDGVRLCEWLERSAATVMQATPATWRMLLSAGWSGRRLSKLFCGGEPLPPELALTLQGRCDALYNLYGPTETTVWSTLKRIHGAEVSIGRPIDNTFVYILDDAGRPVPVGVPGELCIGGAGVADGYLRQPELTAERFVPNPFHSERWPTMYRTGDVARFREDGELECLGRRDGQVKIRGFRVELSEIEVTLRARLTGLDAAVVVSRKTAQGSDQLVAFLVCAPGVTLPAEAQSRSVLGRWLPEYMVPSRFLQLTHLPLTANNKVDRKALAVTPLELLSARLGTGTVADTSSGRSVPDATLSPLERSLRDVVARVLECEPQYVDVHETFGALGLDSVGFTRLGVQLKRELGRGVNPALFFQYSSVSALAAHLSTQSPTEAPDGARAELSAAREQEAVAVVGLAGRFPGAEDLDAFWARLFEGNDCIQDVPRERWDFRSLPEGEHARHGGFLKDVDCFDAPFFGVSPREAAQMDPQQRLFLETAWAALENAGIHPEALRGGRTGVFVGVSGADFLGSAAERSLEGHTLTGLARSILANRLSFLLDLHGPSEPVDTACSSSLVALHRALMAMRQGECDSALVGGVNLILGPFAHLAARKTGMMSPDGRCKPFDASANGYVRSEGVGCLVLRRLSDALRDGDHIWAVLAASAENHGGRSNSLTAPNGTAQADVVATALRRAGWDPRTVGYIETHGTGTALGDPIEVEGLKSAFSTVLAERGDTAPVDPWCALGSVKGNIGHLEAAAGLAGVFKAILCVREGVLPSLVHFRARNPHIELDGSPFRLHSTRETWSRSAQAPRRAGVSSFGMGGSNAHVLVEEAPLCLLPPDVEQDAMDHLFTFSAREPETLNALLERHRAFVSGASRAPGWMARYARTLQLGRASHRERVAVVARTAEELAASLGALLRGETPPGGVRGSLSSGARTRIVPTADTRSQGRDALMALAASWVRGADIEWAALLPVPLPRRLPVPSYPFAKVRYPLASVQGATAQELPAITAVSDSHFRVRLSGEESFLVDHRAEGQPILPGVVHLALALRCVDALRPGTGVRDVLWSHPVMGGGPRELELHLQREAASTGFELASAEGQDGPRRSHSQGRVEPLAGSDVAHALELDPIRERCGTPVDVEAAYATFESHRFVYGPSLRVLRGLSVGPGEALARLEVPSAASAGVGGSTPFIALLDGALQVASVLLGLQAREQDTLSLPFALERLMLHDELPREVLVHVRERPERQASGIRKLDLDLADPTGRVCVALRGFTTRARPSRAPDAPTEATERVVLVPRWQAVREPARAAAPREVLLITSNESLARAFASSGPTTVVLPGEHFAQLGPRRFRVNLGEPEGFRRLLELADAQGLGAEHLLYAVDAGGSRDEAGAARTALLGLIHLGQALIHRKPGGPCKVLVVGWSTPGDTLDVAAAVHRGLMGFAQSVVRESDALRMRGVWWEGLAEDGASAEVLRSELGATERGFADVRYAAGAREERRLSRGVLPEHARFPLEGTCLITGIPGALASQAALHLAERGARRFALLGRRAEDPKVRALVAALAAKGVEARYFQADLGVDTEVAAAVRSIHQGLGPLRAVVHAAGVLDDGYLATRTASRVAGVLAPKVDGVLHLERALAGEPLELFALFGSTSGALGNPGQGDYAFANAFLEGFAAGREALRRRGLRQGRTVCIAWPYWNDGGMRLPPPVREGLQRQAGIVPLGSREGLDAFERLVGMDEPQPVLFSAHAQRLLSFLEQAGVMAGTPVPHEPGSRGESMERNVPVASGRGHEASSLRNALLEHLRRMVSEATRLAPHALRDDGPLQDYGVDSVMTLELHSRLEPQFGSLPKTLIFEHPSLEQLTAHLLETRLDAVTKLLAPRSQAQASPASTPASVSAPPQATTPQVPAVRPSGVDPRPASRPETSERMDIAIVGVAGRYPQAPTLEAFWENLSNGRDCIEEIPAGRWDYRDDFDPERRRSGSSRSKWGGFVEDVDRFDPLFFNITPFEAQFLDPQERLFLQTVWHSLEDAGYTRAQLKTERVGVYVGVMWGQYQLYGHGRDTSGGMVTPASSYASIANRVSYTFNFQGPSIALDTMCSSSLTALHLACEDLRRGATDMAVAGGVNVSVHPAKYVFLSQTGFASTDGRCRSFGDGGDGYVPGEGVGAVLLKPLWKAQRDGDRIHAVIRATTINHGGRGNGYTVPNPTAQSALIRSALEQAGVSASALSYVEAHGTGTALGDPIEIRGLSRAFGQEENRQAPCAIGSIKSNIGHLESAAGIAALTKVLLQMRHRKLVPSLHSEPPNRNIDFAASGFRVQRTYEDWTAPRLLAAISSFGAGGANAHVILEEFRAPARPAHGAAPGPELLVLSARNRERLLEHAQGLERQLARWEHPAAAASPVAAAGARWVEEALLEVLGLEGSGHVLASETLEELGLDAASLVRLGEVLEARSGRPLPADLLGLHRSVREVAGLLSPPGGATTPAVEETSEDVAAAFMDLAFTLQTGREAQETRLAVIASSPAEALAVLRGWREGKSHPNLFEGDLRQGPSRASALFQGEEGRQFLQRLLANQRLNELGLAWTEGAELDWRQLARPFQARRTGAPLYPFARERCWVPFAARKVVTRRFVRPLLHDLDPRRSAGEGLVLRGSLRASSPWVRACVLEDGTRAPVGALLELLAEAFEQVSDQRPVMRELRILEPLGLEEADTVCEVVLKTASEGGWTAFIESSHEGRRTRHLTVFLEEGGSEPPAHVSLDEARQGAELLDAESWYAQLEVQGVRARGPGRLVTRAALGEARVLLDYEAPKGFEADLEAFILHPFVMDLIQQAARMLSPEPLGVAGLARLELEGALPPAGQLLVQRDAEGRFDAFVADPEGRCVSRLTGLRLEARADGISRFFQVPRWRPLRESVPLTAELFRRVALLSFDAQDALAEHLAHAFAGTELTHVRLSAEQARGGVEALLSFLEPLRGADAVYLLCGAELQPVESRDAAATASALRLLAGPVLALLRTVASGGGVPTKLVAVTHRVFDVTGEEPLQPVGGVLVGLLKSAARESPHVSVSVLDLDLGAVPVQAPALAEAARVLAGMRPGPSPREFALRSNRLFERVLHPLSLPAPSASEGRLRGSGTYVIVGGLGNVGFKLARYLASRYQARVALVGRRAETQDIRERLQELESAGGKGLYVSADVADAAQLRDALARVRLRFGSIQGVFHSAMHFNPTRTVELTEQVLLEHLSSKVMGSVALFEACAAEPLDMLVYFSSGESFTGNALWGSYAAGSAFEDAFAHLIQPRAPFPVSVINWGFWDGELGDFGHVLRARGIQPLGTQEGMDALERVLAHRVPQVLALDVKDAILERMGVDFSRRYTLPPPTARAGASTLRPQAFLETLSFDELGGSESARGREDRPTVPGATAPRARPLPLPAAGAPASPATVPLERRAEAWVRDVFSTTLKIRAAEVLPGKSFTDYGADSLVITEVHKTFEKHLGKLPATFLLENDSVTAATTFLLTHHREVLEQALGGGRTPEPGTPARPAEPSPRPGSSREASPPASVRDPAPRGAPLLIAAPGAEALGSYLRAYGSTWKDGSLRAEQERARTRPASRQVASESALRHCVVEVEPGAHIEAFLAGAGSPVLLIPPIGLTAPVWLSQFEHWSRTHQLIVLHPPGYGLSTPQKDVSSASMVRLFLGALSALGLPGPLHVVGSCFGGVAAQYLSAHHPERVLSLTLVGAFYRNFGLPDMPIEALSIDQMVEATRMVGASIQRDFDTVASPMDAQAAASLAGPRELLLQSQCSPPVQVMRYIAEILRFEGMKDLGLIQAPTLCISGTLDTIVAPEMSRIIASTVPRGRLVTIDGAGHYPYLTHDDAFSPRVLEHLREVDKASSGMGTPLDGGHQVRQHVASGT